MRVKYGYRPVTFGEWQSQVLNWFSKDNNICLVEDRAGFDHWLVPVDVGPGYRLLTECETIRSGDEYTYDGDHWVNAGPVAPGNAVDQMLSPWGRTLAYRRPVLSTEDLYPINLGQTIRPAASSFQKELELNLELRDAKRENAGSREKIAELEKSRGTNSNVLSARECQNAHLRVENDELREKIAELEKCLEVQKNVAKALAKQRDSRDTDIETLKKELEESRTNFHREIDYSEKLLKVLNQIKELSAPF